jgi:hypothetical protein
MGGHRLLDIGDRCCGVAAGRVDHGDDARPLETGWTLLRADVVWASTNQDRSAARTLGASTLLWMGLATAATVSLQVVRRRPAGALAHCSRRIRWVESRAEG